MSLQDMREDTRGIVIIGGGIAGLCAAVYAQKSGYQTVVLEMHDTPGGLATSWRRGDYTFETCLHWLLGSNPKGAMYSRWREVFDIGKLTFVDKEEYVRLETEHGEALSIYTNADRMETELLKRADGHATIYDLLGGKYTDKVTEKIYDTLKPFPSYLQVSLGVARDLSKQAGFVTRLLDAPLMVDPDTRLSGVSFRFFHFDPTFAPPGKTAVTCGLLYRRARGVRRWTAPRVEST